MKEKTETKTSTFSETTKAKQEVVKEEKKETAPVVEVKKSDEKSISEMTDSEIEEYLKKRKAKNSFTLSNEDVPMNVLINASAVPSPKLNQDEVLRSMMYRQNKLERTLVKK